MSEPPPQAPVGADPGPNGASTETDLNRRQSAGGLNFDAETLAEPSLAGILVKKAEKGAKYEIDQDAEEQDTKKAETTPAPAVIFIGLAAAALLVVISISIDLSPVVTTLVALIPVIFSLLPRKNNREDKNDRQDSLFMENKVKEADSDKRQKILEMQIAQKRAALIRKKFRKAVVMAKIANVATKPHRGERKNIFIEAPELKVDHDITTYPKNNEDRDFILKALEETIVFAAIKKQNILALIDHMVPQTAPQGHIIIDKGARAQYFFVIKSGEIEVEAETEKGMETTTLQAGNTYGEMSLIYSRAQEEIVRAKTEVTGWVLDRSTYRGVLANANNSTASSVRDCLMSMPIMKSLQDQHINKLADVAVLVDFEKGQTIVKKGETGATICYGILSGTVRVTEISGDGVDIFLERGQYFGELALMTKSPRSATAIAETDLKLFALSTNDTMPLMGKMTDVLRRSHLARILAAVPLFSSFTGTMILSLVRSSHTKSFQKGEAIVRQGDTGESFYLIESGHCDVIHTDEEGNERTVSSLGRNSYFGEMSLLKKVKRQADIVATTETTVVEVGREWFERVMGSSKTFQRHVIEISKSRMKHLRRATNPVEDVTMDQLETVAVLGQGAFGRVTLVKQKGSDLPYALKAMSIEAIENNGMTESILAEKNAMTICDHPFILKLHKTFTDSQRLYFLIDYIVGGELYDAIQRGKGTAHGIPEEHAKFYGACIVLALEHLSFHNLAYRDMKPENTMIDEMGYGKLIDMGFTKPAANKRYTLCGTPEYMAPEIIRTQGHNHSVDFWAFGVLLYEMVCGATPFADYNTDAIFRNVLRGKVRFQEGMSAPLVTLIQSLLEADAAKRLGVLAGGVEDVISHEWFSGINFGDMTQKKVPAPWIPDVKEELDTSNFKEVQQSEESVDENYSCNGEWLKNF